MRRGIATVTLTILVLVVALVYPRSTRAQLGNIDHCDTFYRFAKAHLHEIDYTLTQGQIQAAKLAYEFDTAKSAAYSQLYLACIQRNAQIR